MRRTIFTLFILLLSSGLAMAQQQSSDALKKASQAIPMALIDQGIENMGELKLRKLVQGLESVTWEINSSGLTFAGSGQPRTGAIYLIQQRKVILNAPMTKANILPVLALHEGLGALGYNDENGELSLVMAAQLIMYQKYQNSAVKLESINPSFKNIQIRSTDKIYLSGGGTSVGGGGDGIDLEVKLMTILYLTENLQRLNQKNAEFKKTEKILTKILSTEFENNIEPLVANVTFKKINDHEIVLIPYTEWLWTMLYPQSQFAEEKRNRILLDILDHFQLEI